MKSLSKISLIAFAIFAFVACSNDGPTTSGGSNSGNGSGTGTGGDSTKTTSLGAFDFKDIQNLQFIECFIDSLGNTIDTLPKYKGKLNKNNTVAIPALNNLMGMFLNKVYEGDNKKDEAKYVYAADSTKYYINGEVINSLVSTMAPMGMQLPFTLPKDVYMKVADTKLDKWDAFNQEIKDFAISPLIKLSGNFAVTVNKMPTIQSFNYQASKINVQEFVGTMNFKGTYTFVSGGSPTDIDLKVNIHFLINNKLGIVKQWIPYTVINVSLIKLPINGYKFELK